MKSLSLNVPDEQAQAFAKELATLMKKHGVEVENKEALDAMRPITERVKTFEDAMAVLGENHPLVIQYKEIYDNFSEYLPKFKRIVPFDYKKMMKTIFQMEEKGLSSEQIATSLGISTYAVNQHLDVIRRKLGAQNRTEAVAIAFRKQLFKV